MFELSDFSRETAAKQHVDRLTAERSKIEGYAMMAGNLLGTLGNDLSGGPKFAYELLQNAHDTGSTESPVSLYVFHEGEYLIWAHNGSRLFTPDDVEGISNAARANADEIDHKSKNLGMIGYKGIGFKAVLSKADSVHIISGDFSFGFDRGETRKHLAPYIAKNKTVEYLWQVLPYWMPVEGNSHRLLAMCHTQFQAFKAQSPTLDCQMPKTFFIMHIPGLNFQEEFSFLKEDLSWILFLDNFSKIIFLKEQVCLERRIIARRENQCELQLVHQERSRLTRDSFLILLKEVVKTDDINRDLAKLTDYQCPQRLREAKSTAIKIAFSLTADRQLQALPVGQLFVGLPLAGHKDTRQLVHVQANFLLDTRRYSLTDDGPWNNFLLRSAGHALIEFLASIASSDQPYWNQIFRVFPGYAGRAAVKFQDFYEAIQEAAMRVPFIPANHDRKVLLTLDNAHLDKTGFGYGQGFYYEFPDLKLKSGHNYAVTLLHRELQHVNEALFKKVLSLSGLLRNVDVEYFRTEEMQVRLLNFLVSRPEYFKDEDIQRKAWVLTRDNRFVPLIGLYIAVSITQRKKWYDLCQEFLNLPCMLVSERLSAEVVRGLSVADCRRLDAAEFDKVMIERIIRSDKSLEQRIQQFFSTAETQGGLLSFIVHRLSEQFGLKAWDIEQLKSKKLVLTQLGEFRSFSDVYLPVKVSGNPWYVFCRNLLNLPVIVVADKLTEACRKGLAEKLHCPALTEDVYDTQMCQYVFKNLGNIQVLKEHFSDITRQVSLIRFLQKLSDKISVKDFALLKKATLFLDKRGQFSSCEQLFIPVTSNPQLNQNYVSLLHVSELAVGDQLNEAQKTWLSTQMGITKASQKDFETRFFQLILSSDAKHEKDLQKYFSTPEAQITLLNFISSAAGEKHRSQIQEKSLILANVDGHAVFKKPSEVWILSENLQPEDIALIKEIYPKLPLLNIELPEDKKKQLEKYLRFRGLYPITLAKQLANDLERVFFHKTDGSVDFNNVSNPYPNVVILSFILRYQAMLESEKLIWNFRYLPLKTLCRDAQVRPAFSLYLSSEYHPTDLLEISSDEQLKTAFFSPVYLEWAKSQRIDMQSFRKVLLQLGIFEQLTPQVIPSLSIDNFAILDSLSLIKEFARHLQCTTSVKKFTSIVYHPLLRALISSQLKRVDPQSEEMQKLETLIGMLIKTWNIPLKPAVSAEEYKVGFEFIRFMLLKLVPTLEDHYYITDKQLEWTKIFLPQLSLSSGLKLTGEHIRYLKLRDSLDERACVLLLTGIPQQHNRPDQCYEYYKEIFRCLLKRLSSESGRLKLPGSCLLLAENDTWQPSDKLSYLSLDASSHPSPVYLKKWPESDFKYEDQERLARILNVRVLTSKDLLYIPVEPIEKITWIIKLLTDTGLPYLALVKAQEEAKSREEISRQLKEKLTGWSFRSSETIQIKSRGSELVLQEAHLYVDQKTKVIYLVDTDILSQKKKTRKSLIKELAKLLELKPNTHTEELLDLLFEYLDDQDELKTQKLRDDMISQGYNLSLEGAVQPSQRKPEEKERVLVVPPHQIQAAMAVEVARGVTVSLADLPGDVDTGQDPILRQTVVPSKEAVMLSRSTLQKAEEAPLLRQLDSTKGAKDSATRGSAPVRKETAMSRVPEDEIITYEEYLSGKGSHTGTVRAPKLFPSESTEMDSLSGSVRPFIPSVPGGMELLTQDARSSKSLEDVKPHQLNFQRMQAAVTKTESTEHAVQGALVLKMDPVEESAIPALPAVAVPQRMPMDYLKFIMSSMRFGADTDGVGYWGEAAVFGWLLIQKYGSKFEEPVVENVGQGHCVLRGTVKQESSASQPRQSRYYHMIWHREAGQPQSPHDITVIKHYDSGERKLSVHEVKATKYAKAEADSATVSKISRNQLSEMSHYGNKYRFYRVYSVGTPDAEIEYFRDPAALLREGKLPVKSLGL